jgi:hypothetical protein
MIPMCIHPGCNGIPRNTSKFCAAHSHMAADISHGLAPGPYHLHIAPELPAGAVNLPFTIGAPYGANGGMKDKVIAGIKPTDPRMEFSGNDVNYYLLEIKDPKRLAPYTAECEDIIEALGMTFAEGNVLKALWRSCNMRVHGHGKRGQDAAGAYDGDKIAYYGKRIQAQRKRELDKKA